MIEGIGCSLLSKRSLDFQGTETNAIGMKPMPRSSTKFRNTESFRRPENELVNIGYTECSEKKITA
jgi:hypothetical protein